MYFGSNIRRILITENPISVDSFTTNFCWKWFRHDSKSCENRFVMLIRASE